MFICCLVLVTAPSVGQAEVLQVMHPPFFFRCCDLEVQSGSANVCCALDSIVSAERVM